MANVAVYHPQPIGRASPTAHAGDGPMDQQQQWQNYQLSQQAAQQAVGAQGMGAPQYQCACLALPCAHVLSGA